MPQIFDIRFQIIVTSEHVADFGWVPFSELGDWAAKKRKKKERKKKESVVKHKSADRYVERPNNQDDIYGAVIMAKCNC